MRRRCSWSRRPASRALPVIYLVFPARDRGGNEFGYPDDLVGAHWVAAARGAVPARRRPPARGAAQASFRIRITQFHMSTSRTSGIRAINASRASSAAPPVRSRTPRQPPHEAQHRADVDRPERLAVGVLAGLPVQALVHARAQPRAEEVARPHEVAAPGRVPVGRRDVGPAARPQHARDLGHCYRLGVGRVRSSMFEHSTPSTAAVLEGQLGRVRLPLPLPPAGRRRATAPRGRCRPAPPRRRARAAPACRTPARSRGPRSAGRAAARSGARSPPPPPPPAACRTARDPGPRGARGGTAPMKRFTPGAGNAAAPRRPRLTERQPQHHRRADELEAEQHQRDPRARPPPRSAAASTSIAAAGASTPMKAPCARSRACTARRGRRTRAAPSPARARAAPRPPPVRSSPNTAPSSGSARNGVDQDHRHGGRGDQRQRPQQDRAGVLASAHAPRGLGQQVHAEAHGHPDDRLGRHRGDGVGARGVAVGLVLHHDHVQFLEREQQHQPDHGHPGAGRAGRAAPFPRRAAPA